MNLQIPLEFLKQLKTNNNRDWFDKNRTLYQEAKNEFEKFVEFLIPLVKSVDKNIDVLNAKECVFRIFRDVRFSKNKLPYKTNFGAFISKGGRKSPFAGFYIHIEPGGSFVGGGVYAPQAEYLKAIRTEIFEKTEEYKSIVNNDDFKKYFVEIYGEKLKTSPRGFSKNFPDIDLLRNKNYAVVYKVNDSFWVSSKLLENLLEIFNIQFAFIEFLNKAVSKV